MKQKDIAKEIKTLNTRLLETATQINALSKQLDLDTLINNMQTDLTMDAFYLGVNFTLNLLDREATE